MESVTVNDFLNANNIHDLLSVYRQKGIMLPSNQAVKRIVQNWNQLVAKEWDATKNEEPPNELPSLEVLITMKNILFLEFSTEISEMTEQKVYQKVIQKLSAELQESIFV